MTWVKTFSASIVLFKTGMSQKSGVRQGYPISALLFIL